MYRLLLVEDESATMKRLSKLVNYQEYGFELCGQAIDGESALEICQETPPDLVITDIRMPGIDGLALAAQLQVQYPQTRVVLLSGYGEFTYAQQAIRLNISQYLLKPIDCEELQQVLLKEHEQLIKRDQNTSAHVTPNAHLLEFLFAWEAKNLPVLIQVESHQELQTLLHDLFRGLKEENAGTNDMPWVMQYLMIKLDAYIQEIGESLQKTTAHLPDIESMQGKSLLQWQDWLERYWLLSYNQLQRKRAKRINPISSQMIEIIEKEYASDINLQHLSKHLHIHEVYMGQVFIKETNTTFSDYLTRFRIRKACELLEDNSLSIEEVGYRVGYPFAGNFTRSFKRIMNASPNEYRQRIKGTLKRNFGYLHPESNE